jgi:hypothetical protein
VADIAAKGASVARKGVEKAVVHGSEVAGDAAARTINNMNAGIVPTASAGAKMLGAVTDAGKKVVDASVKAGKESSQNAVSGISKVGSNIKNYAKNNPGKAAGIAAGTVAATALATYLINKVNKRIEWKANRCEDLEGNERIKCLNFIKNKKYTELRKQLGDCGRANDPKKCKEFINSELKTLK